MPLVPLVPLVPVETLELLVPVEPVELLVPVEPVELLEGAVHVARPALTLPPLASALPHPVILPDQVKPSPARHGVQRLEALDVAGP